MSLGDDISQSDAAEDAAAILRRVDELALKPAAGARGWEHMGAVIVDAGLQAAMKYSTTVLPRVKRVLQQWPEATTTIKFAERLEAEDLAAFLTWKPTGKKITLIRALTDFLVSEAVDTPAELRQALVDESFRRRLRGVKGVGPKTVDYLSILTGSTTHVAVDSQLLDFARAAGATTTTYEGVRRAVVQAASQRGWEPGALDAAIWDYQSTRARQKARTKQ